MRTTELIAGFVAGSRLQVGNPVKGRRQGRGHDSTGFRLDNKPRRPCEMKRRADLAVGTLYLTFFLYIYRKHSHDKYLPCLALESVPTVKNHKAE
ncbi:hypothetical protein RUM44_000582 [Polyplax serrata]|uniref:Uncharacterized protein n=1 Tax=Polyplax serrata TaxID=468196 RepID=A0ABR1B5V3_POLSC